MLLPEQYARAYAELWSWMLVGEDWSYTRTPIVSYLQNGSNAMATRAKATHQALLSGLQRKTGDPGIGARKTFQFNGDDYINLSITRTFIGKACPWEIQETMQLASQLGLVVPEKSRFFCTDNVGVDCGGFVANYWGVGVPHMAEPNPSGAYGISPRSFWSDNKTWPDVMQRRRSAASAVRPGDAAIFFKDIKGDNPDLAKQRDAKGNLIAGTGSEAFHIGLVNQVGGSTAMKLDVAESSGARSAFGGNGVNVRSVNVTGTGVSCGKWVYAEVGGNERIYFVAPPAGWGPEMAYSYGDE